MAAVINNITAKRKKEQDADDNVSLSHNKKPRVVWTPHLHSKFLDAVHVLGLDEVVPRKIIALMNVEGITKQHVASHLQKYRLSQKKAIDRVPSKIIVEPTQSQTYFNIHPQSYNFPVNQTSSLLLPNNKPVVHQSNMSGVGVAPSTLIQSQNINIHPPTSTYPIYHHTPTLFPSPLGFPTPAKPVVHQSNMSGVGVAPSTPIQSQNINIHPPTSTYPIYHDTSTLFPSPLGFPTPAKPVVHQSNMSGVGVAPSTPIQSQNINIHPPTSTYPIYHDTSTLFPSPLGFPTPAKPVVHQSNMSGVGVVPSTLIQSQNINIHPPPSTYPIYHDTSTLFPSPLGFPTPANSSKSTSIWDYHWHITEPHSLLFPHGSLSVLESHNTSQNTQMSSQQTEPIIVESTSLEDTNIMDYNLSSHMTLKIYYQVFFLVPQTIHLYEVPLVQCSFLFNVNLLLRSCGRSKTILR
ncbi:unnamed protein product [Lathyrus sativus]|nr:unnamed protein product [Lathyrus sativus]